MDKPGPDEVYVEAMRQLIGDLAGKGLHVISVSTSYVFDGFNGYYCEDSLEGLLGGGGK